MDILLKINNLVDVYIDAGTNKDYMNLILNNYELINIEYDKVQNTTIFFLSDSVTDKFYINSGYNCDINYHNDGFELFVYDADVKLFVVNFDYDKPDYDVILNQNENDIINICDDLSPNVLGCVEYILARYFNKLAQ